MNHIEYYQQKISDTSIDFDTRHQLKQFYTMDLTIATETVETIFKMLRLKQIDLEVLKKLEQHDMQHN